MRSHYLTPDELSLLRAALAPWKWLPLWVSEETGLRVGDVVALPYEALRRDGIHFTAQKTGKSGVSRISADLRRALLANTDGVWLFPSPYKAGKHLTRSCVWYRMKRSAERAGLPTDGISPHSMRKVFGVETYRRDGMRATMAALQHTHEATTELYALSDFFAAENSNAPLLRRDLQLIIRACLEAFEAKKEG